MINFIPLGYQEDQIKPCVISRFSISNRKLVVCEYGAMIGVFDFVTGGKICDFSIYKYPGHTDREYIEAALKKANATVQINTDWLEILDKLPDLNYNETI